MSDMDELKRILERIDGRGYKAYKEIEGGWAFPDWTLVVDHVQGDPYAAPSRLRVFLEPEVSGLPGELCAPRGRALGVAALLARRFAGQARKAKSRRGSGKSGLVEMEHPGQVVLPQTAVMVSGDGSVEARFRVGLPARGRRVLGRQAAELLAGDVPAVVEASLLASSYDEGELAEAAETNEDADALRAVLDGMGLVGFVADGASLPRRSGVDDRPLTGDEVVPFRSPGSLRVEVELPNARTVTGMGIPRGVTLIVGGGYHGKSTLLRALEQGVYNHRPGDGREKVVSEPATVKVRAEDGRSVKSVDISPFIAGLPLGVDTRSFSSANASGSTSQAANIMEALEAGATALLVDEDTAATNFMIRDRRMQALVPKESEPITPFVDRIRPLHDEHGVSSVLVIGGSGDYLDVADTIVAMKEYVPHDVTDEARAVAREWPTGRIAEGTGELGPRPARVPDPASVDPSRGKRSVSVKVRDEDRVLFGTEEIDLTAVEQIVSWSQARTVSEALVTAWKRFMDGERTLPEILDAVMQLVEEEGLDGLSPWHPGELTLFRRFELAAALNRLRTLETVER